MLQEEPSDLETIASLWVVPEDLFAINVFSRRVTMTDLGGRCNTALFSRHQSQGAVGSHRTAVPAAALEHFPDIQNTQAHRVHTVVLSMSVADKPEIDVHTVSI